MTNFKSSGNLDNRGKIQGNQAVLLYDTERQISEFMRSGQFREAERKGIDVPFVSLESVLVATNKFSEANKLGQGGFGPVYKVILCSSLSFLSKFLID